MTDNCFHYLNFFYSPRHHHSSCPIFLHCHSLQSGPQNFSTSISHFLPLWSFTSRLMLQCIIHTGFILIFLVLSSGHLTCHSNTFYAFTLKSPVSQLIGSPRVGKDIPQKTALLYSWNCLSKSTASGNHSCLEWPQILGEIKLRVIIQVKSRSLEWNRDKGQSPNIKRCTSLEVEVCVCLGVVIINYP